ncbi:MAG: MarC family protein, partial [Trinickia sp.]
LILFFLWWFWVGWFVGGVEFLRVGVAFKRHFALLGNRGGRAVARAAPESKNSIAVVPLAIPLLTGPGTISTVIVYSAGVAHWYDRAGLIAIGAAIAVICFWALRMADPIARFVGQTGINIGTRLMGLMLSALAVEFIVDGLKALLPNLR